MILIMHIRILPMSCYDFGPRKITRSAILSSNVHNVSLLKEISS